MIAFIDLDGVVADFFTDAVDVACRYWGASFRRGGDPAAMEKLDPQIKRNWPPGEWDIAHVLGLTISEFWEAINDQANFWESLNKYEWADSIIAAVVSLGMEPHFLSSPSRSPASHSGKREWVSEHFSGIPLTLTNHKHLLAGPDRLLIDDGDKNFKRFGDAGGNAFLFPRPWNANHQWAEAPTIHLGMELESLRRGQDQADT